MAEIKISDLSIGDWVATPCAKGYIIDLYTSEKAGCIARLVHDDVQMVSEWECIHLEPIPLTPEILEKNGFRKNGEYNEWNIGEWNERPFIGVSLDRQSMRVKYFGNDIFIENKVVFVHQLQNALRLASVEKEIML